MLFEHRYFEKKRPKTNFADICEVFGGIGYRVDKLNELDSTIRYAFKEEGFRLIYILVDPMELLPPQFLLKRIYVQNLYLLNNIFVNITRTKLIQNHAKKR